jgi:hypothetical protein
MADEQRRAALQSAARASAESRRLQGHNRRQAEGKPCKRCWICFPETGKRDSSLPRVAVPAQSVPTAEQTFAEKALPLAEAGTPEAAAALILGLSAETFQVKVTEAYGVGWSAVLERAKHKVKSDLISSAIRAARAGDWKPYLSLEKAGVSLSLVEREEATTSEKQPTSIAEVDAELARLDAIEKSFGQSEGIKGKGVKVISRDVDLGDIALNE